MNSKFEKENLWKVSDIEYELVDSDHYVHPTAREVAEDIIKIGVVQVETK
jgi:hypothetical protein